MKMNLREHVGDEENSKEQDLLLTGQVARVMQCSPITVARMMEKNEIQGFVIPGGENRRLIRQSVEECMRRHGMEDFIPDTWEHPANIAFAKEESLPRGPHARHYFNDTFAFGWAVVDGASTVTIDAAFADKNGLTNGIYVDETGLTKEEIILKKAEIIGAKIREHFKKEKKAKPTIKIFSHSYCGQHIVKDDPTAS